MTIDITAMIAELKRDADDEHFDGQILSQEETRALLQHIEGQAAQVEGLRSALEPFAAMAATGFEGSVYENREPQAQVIYHHSSEKAVTIGDFSRAFSALTQTPAHSLASHDAELLERIAGEINTLLRKVGTGSFAAKCCCAMAETLMDEAARIRAEAGEQQAKGAE